MATIHPVSYYYYDVSRGWQKICWYEQHAKQAHVPNYSLIKDNAQIRVATFNVLMDIFEDIEPAICSTKRHPYHFSHVLPSVDADVFCLQEVTNPYLSTLCRDEFIKHNYPYISTFTDRTEWTKKYDRRNFFNIILSRVPFKELYLFHIDANRPVPIVVMQHPHSKEEFTISTVHLKAGRDSDHIRKIQLANLFQLFGTSERNLDSFKEENKVMKFKHSGKTVNSSNKKPTIKWKEFDNVILCGDFNLQLEHEETFFPKTTVDVWKHLKPDEIGYTSDASRNIMIVRQAALKGKNPGSDRFDRILLLPRNKFAKNAKAQSIFKPVEITFFAEDPVPIEGNNEVYPSDHFGVVANINLV